METDAFIDSASARLAGIEREPLQSAAPDGPHQIQAAMLAIAAAAYAVDGFYGTIKPLVTPPKSNAARERQIIEAIKLGFRIGSHAKRWTAELDWLFDLRDSIVHHAELIHPLVVPRVTRETILVGGVETFNLSAESARRAADLAFEITLTCLQSPKKSTRQWAEESTSVDSAPAAAPSTGPARGGMHEPVPHLSVRTGAAGHQQVVEPLEALPSSIPDTQQSYPKEELARPCQRS